MFKTKLSLLLIAILLLNIDFLLLSQVFANEITSSQKSKDAVTGTEAKIISRFSSTGTFNRASNPDCGQFSTGAAVEGIAILVGALWTGIVVLVSSVGLFTAIVIVGMIAATVGVWKAIGGLVVCQHSFVRHPVIRDNEGKYNGFKFSDKGSSYESQANKTYKNEDDYFKELGGSLEEGKKIDKELLDSSQPLEFTNEYYWPRNGIQYSDHIEICNRDHLAFNVSKLLSSEDSVKKYFDIREKELGNPGKGWLAQVDGELECKTLKVGQSVDIHGSQFRAVKRGAKLCVQLDSVSWLGIKMTPWPSGVDMGCTALPPDPGAPMCEKSKMIFVDKEIKGDKILYNVSSLKDLDYKSEILQRKSQGYVFDGYDNSACFPDYISNACYNQAGSKSLSPLPITSMVVQCIKESLDNLIGVETHTLQGKSNFLSNAQKTLRNTVTAALVLALILFSIKVMSGGVRSPQEMYMLIIKFALVVYFTTGNGMSTYYKHLTDLSNGLSDIVLQASSESKGICSYDVKNYIHTDPRSGEKRNYSYLAPWDKLDCRMLFYLGAPLGGVSGKIATGSLALAAVLFGTAPILLLVGSLLGIVFAGGQILVAFIAILMAVMMVMIILWMTYTFILSLVAISVLVILSPLLIPMVLFHHTKGYFDNWIKELITYSLYPVLLFAFLSFMFIACDKIFFKGLKFEPEPLQILDQKKTWFKLSGDSCEGQKNSNTLACILQNYTWEKSSILGLFSFTYIKFKYSPLGEILKLSLILFLFYTFLSILPSIIADLAGNPRAAIGSGNTPQGMMKKALSIPGGVGQVAAAALSAASRKSSSASKNDDSKGGKSSESLKSSDS